MYYSDTHQWARIEGEIAWVGITRHAAHELEDIVHISLPEIGKHVLQGEILCSVEAVKADSPVHAPLSGTVVEVNRMLDRFPEVLNQDPEGEGWICRLKLEAPTEISRLMDVQTYLAHLK